MCESPNRRLGGIPIPVGAAGSFFWTLFIIVQLCECVLMLSSLWMTSLAYFSIRFRFHRRTRFPRPPNA